MSENKKVRMSRKLKAILEDVVSPLAHYSEGQLMGNSRNERPEDEELPEELESSKLYEYTISIIEFAIINNFLFKCASKKISGIKTIAYGSADSNTGRVSFGGGAKDNYPWWFNVTWDKIDDMVMFQTRQFTNSYNQLVTTFGITTKKGLSEGEYRKIFKEFKGLAYNNSEYKGKCLKIKLIEGSFDGIEILDTSDFDSDIILTDTQRRFLDHFVNSVKNGNTARYLFSGKPGSGKSESIRNIIYKLRDIVTFVIPEFHNPNDLLSILESCSIFNPGILIIDDIDLYLANRSGNGGNGSLTALNAFLQFFDGIKKNKISIIGSTNSKEMLDVACERPGRFNFILDFSYLTDTQIEAVCNLHLNSKWQIKEVYDALRGNDELGKKINVTGAFISNLSHNINSMSQSDENWTLEDTLSLIKQSYKGFYGSQLSLDKKRLGFNTDALI
jgi:hypothetical protein